MTSNSKTSLSFEAPTDLSVGHISIHNEQGPVADWVATALSRTFRSPELNPGIYTAEIAPPGIRPRIFVFEVKSDMANIVATPLFSTLTAGGNSAGFSGVPNMALAFESLHRGRTKEESFQSYGEAHSVQIEPLGKGPRSAAAPKKISIGISREQASLTESWRPFEGEVSVEVASAGYVLRIFDELPKDTGNERRIRLSLALEKIRVERFLLPLYRGGTVVAVTPSSLSTSDIELSITPADPRLRALYRALEAGTPEIATAVRSDILGENGIALYLVKGAEEPWGAMLGALLAIRFPDIFRDVLAPHADTIRRRLSWAYDAHIIYAKYILSNAPRDHEGRLRAARTAIEAIKKAQHCGSPYFTYANQVAGEMLEGLASIDSLDSELARKAARLLSRWQRYLPLQRGAGASFSWNRRDRDLLRRKIIRPYTGTTGSLERRHSRIIIRGHVGLGQISMDMETNAAPKELAGRAASEAGKTILQASGPALESKLTPPALTRAVQFPDDPNKGRFGGQAVRGGYTLSATFQPGRSQHWVTATLTIRADEPHPRNYSDIVSFCLHPTFDPQWINAVFRGREASITVKIWGGFTVGAWLQERGVELECDLALLSDAPTIVREL